MSSMEGTTRLERDQGGLAVLSFDNPPVNLFDRPTLDGFLAAVDALEAEPARALLIRAEGPNVTAGIDVELFRGVPPERAGELIGELLAAIGRLERLPLPTVFAAHGLTLTVGFEIALGCDLIIAAPAAKFGLVERVVGLTPGMGGTQRLAERAGVGRARRLVMGAELCGAEDLARWGVVDRLLEADDFDAAARTLAAELAAGPTLAHAATKRVLQGFREGGVSAADGVAASAVPELFGSEDLHNAVAAFVETGGPGFDDFHGR